jgi:hypothetical protein
VEMLLQASKIQDWFRGDVIPLCTSSYAFPLFRLYFDELLGVYFAEHLIGAFHSRLIPWRCCFTEHVIRLVLLMPASVFERRWISLTAAVSWQRRWQHEKQNQVRIFVADGMYKYNVDIQTHVMKEDDRKDGVSTVDHGKQGNSRRL